MTIVALIKDNKVIGVQPSDHPDIPLHQQFHPLFNPTDVTNLDPKPEIGWDAVPNPKGGWTFSPPPSQPKMMAAKPMPTLSDLMEEVAQLKQQVAKLQSK